MGFQSVSSPIFSVCYALVAILASSPFTSATAAVGAAFDTPACEKVEEVGSDAADVLSMIQAPVGSAVDDAVSEKVDVGSDAADDRAHLVRLRRREARTQDKLFYRRSRAQA